MHDELNITLLCELGIKMCGKFPTLIPCGETHQCFVFLYSICTWLKMEKEYIPVTKKTDGIM